MDLFEYQKETFSKKESPIANRLRPKTLKDFVGQKDIIGENTVLYKAIKADKISSLILYGASGTGKTTLAKIIANETRSAFYQINATFAGIKELKEVIEKAQKNIALSLKKTILFIDEIHRFNKSQQDILLPFVEDGTIVLIGATTENPFFEVNKALISRSIVFELTPLDKEDIKKIILNALNNKEKGLASFNITIEEDALDFIAKKCGGDARIALNAIELLVFTTDTNKICLKDAINCMQNNSFYYDKKADNHYNTISAFIKSMRGSDPDAAVYYLAKMLLAGEDPKFIARRIIILASEDIGNADPHALKLAVSAFEAVNIVGMPEARIILSHAACYMATAPKSNACYLAINNAIEDVKNIPIKEIPPYLKDSHAVNNKSNDYKYPHNFYKNYVKQQYLPKEIDKKYYNPTDNGYEKNIKKWLDFLNSLD